MMVPMDFWQNYDLFIKKEVSRPPPPSSKFGACLYKFANPFHVVEFNKTKGLARGHICLLLPSPPNFLGYIIIPFKGMLSLK